MKKTLLSSVLLAFFFTSSFGQGIHITFTPEGVQSANENTDLLLSDPLINHAAFYIPPAFTAEKNKASGAAEEEESAGRIAGVTVGVETEVSGPNKSVNLPLNYAWRDFNFGLILPYIYQRKMKYSVVSKESSGIGDIAVNAGYSWRVHEMLFDGNIFVKLPTGDDENMVDGYLVPTGTGSTDMLMNLSGMKGFDRSCITGNAIVRINGSSTKIAEIVHTDNPDNNPSTTDIETIDYTAKNGAMFSFTGGYDYFQSPKLTLGGWIVFSMTGEGSTETKHSNSWSASEHTVSGISNKQDMILLDIVPRVSYRIFFTDLTLMMKIPVYTDRNPDNTEDSRGMTVLLKLSRNF